MWHVHIIYYAYNAVFPLLYDERGGPPHCFSKAAHPKICQTCHLLAISCVLADYSLAIKGNWVKHTL